MHDQLIEKLLDLLDDALDEIERGDPDVYTEEEREAYLRCYQHWQEQGSFTDDDVAFLTKQLEADSESQGG